MHASGGARIQGHLLSDNRSVRLQRSDSIESTLTHPREALRLGDVTRLGKAMAAPRGSANDRRGFELQVRRPREIGRMLVRFGRRLGLDDLGPNIFGGLPVMTIRNR